MGFPEYECLLAVQTGYRKMSSGKKIHDERKHGNGNLATCYFLALWNKEMWRKKQKMWNSPQIKCVLMDFNKNDETSQHNTSQLQSNRYAIKDI